MDMGHDSVGYAVAPQLNGHVFLPVDHAAVPVPWKSTCKINLIVENKIDLQNKPYRLIPVNFVILSLFKFSFFSLKIRPNTLKKLYYKDPPSSPKKLASYIYSL